MKVLIMAAGTGGHVFPALAIAACLQQQGNAIEWLGTQQGMEVDILKKTDIPLHGISVKGLRGKGLLRLLAAPIMITVATAQAMQVIRKSKPACVLGMGGFVCGPGGVAAKLLGKPLVIHEQNAVAGATNRLLARVANKVLQAFPNTFPASARVFYTGNPVRADIRSLERTNSEANSGPLKILILGGSQGAVAINEVIPKVLANWTGSQRPEVLHQTGKANYQQAKQCYQTAAVAIGENTRVQPFIDDMAAAYAWADLVICRSGASTVSEIAVVGLLSILIPYPHHADQQQTKNAQWLSNEDAAILLQQSELTPQRLQQTLQSLDNNRGEIKRMGLAAKNLAIIDAEKEISRHCLEAAHA